MGDLVLQENEIKALELAEFPRLPGTDIVGRGYDATGEYANPDCVRLPIFDLGPFDGTIVAPNGVTYAVPGRVADQLDLADMSHGEYKRVSGETAEEYRKSLNVKASVSAGYGLFSGSVRTEFDSKELASFNHTFVTLYHHFAGWKLVLPDPRTLPMLPSAKADIDGTSGLSARQTIEKYGTHVVASAVIGGRAKYTCFVDRSRYKSETSVITAVEASYKAVLKLDVSMETQYKEAVEKLRTSSRTEFETVGGEFPSEFNPESFVDWMNAFKAHPVLIDFSKGSLVELFTLTSDPVRGRQLEAAFTESVEESQKLVPDDMPLLEVTVFPSGECVGTDAGSGAKQNLSVYRPNLSGPWRWVGQSANRSDRFLIIRPLVPGAVVDPIHFDRAWCDAGSGKKHGYSLWNVVAPPGYRALGGLARLRTGRTDWRPPAGGAIQTLVCVHESLCTEGRIGDRAIWNDRGSGAHENGSVWPIEARDEKGIESYTFYAAGGHSRPNATVYVLKSDPRIKRTS